MQSGASLSSTSMLLKEYQEEASWRGFPPNVVWKALVEKYKAASTSCLRDKNDSDTYFVFEHYREVPTSLRYCLGIDGVTSEEVIAMKRHDNARGVATQISINAFMKDDRGRSIQVMTEFCNLQHDETTWMAETCVDFVDLDNVFIQQLLKLCILSKIALERNAEINIMSTLSAS